MHKNVYSVGQINSYIGNLFTQDFFLSSVSIRGEVSNCKYHSSGHIYFTLKDKNAALSAVMFAGNRRTGLSFPMREGDSVVVSGSVSAYEKTGTYSLYAKRIERDGQGDLFLRFEALKRELEEMGMFAAEYKQEIPAYAGTIGIVTAPTGAAIQDIRNIAGRRNPGVQLILYPALVQGEGAAASIVNGIRCLDALGVDVMIVGRGGGSIEDLWAFNEEIVARAIFECRTPVISAVGHETDWTIADFAADMRAPTPSAAAELAVFDLEAAKDRVRELGFRMTRVQRNRMDLAAERLKRQKMQLEFLSPAGRMQENRKTLLNLRAKMQQSMELSFLKARHRLEIDAKRLDGNSPLKKLESGYAYVEKENGRQLRLAEEARAGENIRLYLKDGSILAQVSRVDCKEESGQGHS